MFQNIRCLTKHWVFLIVVCFSALCHNWRLFFSSCDLFFVCFSVVCFSAQCCVLLCTMLWLSTNQVCQPRPDGFPANWSLPILSQPPAMSMSPPENALYTFLTLCSTIYITHTILHIAQQYTYHTVTHHTAAQYT